MLLNATVAEAISELTDAIRKELKTTESRDDAVLKVIRDAFKKTTAVRFEGNNYSDAWVTEAKKRGLPNFRRTPEALGQIITKPSRDLFVNLGILTKEEIDSRYSIRLERYIKDMLIEMHTLAEMANTLLLPAGYGYAGAVATAAARAKAAGVKPNPMLRGASEAGALVTKLQGASAALMKAIEKAESMHHDAEKQAQFLTAAGAAAMESVRAASDTLEINIGDGYWPLPRYREMLFPV
jgi:glutamine synthetase